MEKHLRGKGLWIGLGVLGVLFLCLLVFGAGTMMFAGRSAPVYVQPAPGAEGAAPLPQGYYGHGPMGLGRHGGFGLFGIIGFGLGLIFKLLFFGLLALLLLGLVRRFFWGHRHPAWMHYGKPPKGEKWEGKPHAWGPPWAWHHHGGPCGPQAEAEAEADESDDSESAYTGPQE